MITLTDERGLIFSPKSWVEIEEIPGYIKGLDPEKHKLKAIIGSYHLKDIHCGLSECNSPHDKGYIVQTQSGAVTNIGNICGQNYFGVDFTTFANKHNREVTAKIHRDLLFTFSLQLDGFVDQINELRHCEYGIDWIYRTSQNLISRGKDCPDEVVRAVNVMIKSRTNMLQKEREATDTEIRALELSRGKSVKGPHYIQQDIAVIAGLNALHEENDLKKLVIHEMDENIKHFKDINIDQLSHSELARWAKWIGSIESTLEKIKNSITAGRALLKSSNLSAFKEIIDKKQDIDRFDKFIKKLPM